LTPDEIISTPELTKNNFYNIPNTWNNQIIDGQTLKGKGYATFALEIQNPNSENTLLALEIHEILTAYTLWADNKIISTRGVAGKTSTTSTPEFKPATLPLPIFGNSITLTLQVSNYHHRKGGPWTSIYLGSASKIHTSASNQLFLNIFLVGSIFMMGIYHLSMFLLGGKYKSSMFFGIFCCLISLRSLVTNERYLHILIPGLNWETLEKIEYLSFYFAVPIFAMFIISIFPREFPKKVLRLIQVIALGFILLVFVTPAIVFTHTVNAFQVYTILASCYLFYVLFRAFKMKREGTNVILAGFLIFFITILNDILYVNGIIQTGSLIPLGMFVFIFSQAFLLSLIYSRTFKKIENQKIQLGHTNIAFKEEIQMRQALQSRLERSHEKSKKSRIALILGLAKLAEYRDEDTGTHLKRIREFSILLAMNLSKIEKYRDYITPDYINDIHQSSILHDIGKVGIKDAILLKPGKLTDEEFEIIKAHTTIGGDAIAAIETEVNDQSFLTLAKNIAYSHHEKWDGTGYPQGLKEENIPLSARIVAVADVYDALTSERSYKKEFSHGKAIEIITQGRGMHFDPLMIDIFLTLSDQFQEIKKKYVD